MVCNRMGTDTGASPWKFIEQFNVAATFQNVVGAFAFCVFKFHFSSNFFFVVFDESIHLQWVGNVTE